MNSLLAKKIIAYGAGERGALFFDLCNSLYDVLPFSITAYCDKNHEKQKNGFMGFPVIPPDQLASTAYSEHHIVITPKVYREILSDLLDMGFKDNHIHILSQYIQHIIDKQYFDDTIPLDYGKNHVFIDAGCYNFVTSEQFMKWSSNQYARIVGFEPNAKQFSICLQAAQPYNNVKLYPYALWYENVELDFSINDELPSASKISETKSINNSIVKAVKLDDVLDEQEVTFIKMDIEGAELNALKGAENIIRNNRPILAICIYHKPSDIFEIPDYILSLNSDYQLYLRHYSFSQSETVLYAI